MENETDWREQAVNKASRQRSAFCSGKSEANSVVCLHENFSVKEEVKRTVRSLVERFGLSREDLVSAYDECVLERDEQEVRVEKNDAAFGAAFVQQQASKCDETSASVQVNGVSGESIMEVQEEGGGSLERVAMRREEGGTRDSRSERKRWEKENGTGERELESVSDSSQVEEKEEVDKMQTLVQSALRVYEATSLTPELGQKRRCFTLEEELNLQPSSFAQELLE